MSKKILLTGGGTAGHVTPNLALIPKLKAEGYEISYMGSKDGIEKRLVEEMGIPYYGVSTGKLRRYFAWKNFTDPFRVIKGFFEAKSQIKKLAPDVVFSKGGFVSVPIVRAAHLKHIPCIIHESDMSPGLANKLCFSAAHRVCCNFPETLNELPAKKGVVTGTPIRKELLDGSKLAGLTYCGFDGSLPVLLIIGGSQGARAINEAVRSCLPDLLRDFNIIHICGNNNLDEKLNSISGYAQFGYVKEELKDLFAAADIVISRAGANAIFELLALKKPNLLIPLPLKGSRGDQLQNANSFKNSGFSAVLPEEELSDATLLSAISALYSKRNEYVEAMRSRVETADSIDTIVGLINEAVSASSR